MVLPKVPLSQKKSRGTRLEALRFGVSTLIRNNAGSLVSCLWYISLPHSFARAGMKGALPLCPSLSLYPSCCQCVHCILRTLIRPPNPRQSPHHCLLRAFIAARLTNSQSRYSNNQLLFSVKKNFHAEGAGFQALLTAMIDALCAAFLVQRRPEPDATATD